MVRAQGPPRDLQLAFTGRALILVSPFFEGVRFIKRLGIVREQLEPRRYGLSIDVLCYTPEEFEVMGTGIGMVADAAREGIWLK